jgi:TRAP-type C4-dicarboxylate transport system permease large subunit
MTKESIEQLAREKAEKVSKEEAWTVQLVAYIPFILVACIMAATGVSASLFMTVVLAGLLVSFALYFSMKPYAYKKYYEEYLKEFTVLRGGEKE